MMTKMKLDWIHLVLVVVVMFGVNVTNANRYNYTYYINELQKPPIYIDNSSACPKLFYGAYRVAKNCSSLNIASNYQILVTDKYYVTELILSNNNFGANLPYNEINAYDSLDYLDLSWNSINEFTNDLVLIDCSANYLKEINLNYNLFSKFPVFNRTCSCLRALRLNHNPNLIKFDLPSVYNNNITKQLISLLYLDLSYNSIQYINLNQYTLLYHFPSLVYLNLYGNQILNIYANPFLWTPQLMYLTFEGNRIQCTVDILWVKYYLLSKLPPEPYTRPTILEIMSNGSVASYYRPYFPTCFSVLTNQTESIVNLSNSSFYTNIFLTSTLINLTTITVDAGQTVQLDCTAYSQPPPDLWWTFNDRVLSRIVGNDSPYEFIENFNSTVNPTNKTSILRIKNVFGKLSGVYSCKATYMNMTELSLSNISALFFTLAINGGQPGGLSPGAIAGIVIGAILAFLLACLLIALCIWCCCYQLGWCLWCCLCCPCCARCSRCCPGAGGAAVASKKSRESTSSKSRLYAEKNAYDNRRFNQMSELEEKQSGFDDMLAQRTRPNYVINSISKSTSSLNDYNQNQGDLGKSYNVSTNDFYQIAPVTVEASSSSWRIPKPTHHHHREVTDTETLVYSVSGGRKQNPYISNEAFIGDSVKNLAHTSNTNIVDNCNAAGDCFNTATAATNKRYVETTKFSQNRYIPSPVPGNEGEMINENYFNQIVIEDEERRKQQQQHQHQHQHYDYAPPVVIQQQQQQSSINKQYKNIPIVTTSTTSGYPKYDSDV